MVGCAGTTSGEASEAVKDPGPALTFSLSLAGGFILGRSHGAGVSSVTLMIGFIVC
jgi:hypothetical protein